uniref:Uncharacterized protein n=1 Tax=Arundo donax TaxID=35708 RepID=A0A0A9DBE7_ARUDO
MQSGLTASAVQNLVFCGFGNRRASGQGSWVGRRSGSRSKNLRHQGLTWLSLRVLTGDEEERQNRRLPQASG